MTTIIIVIALIVIIPILAQKMHKEEPKSETSSPENTIIHLDWECPECKAENDGDQPVCYQCQYMHPTIDVPATTGPKSCCG